jgi:hypothetical protein
MDALASPAERRDIPVTLRAELAAAAQGGAVAVVTVHVEGTGVTFASDAKGNSFNLELATAVSDGAGALAQVKVETLDGRLSARATDLARANGFRVTRQLTLAPGRYVVRAALREPATGKIGSATATVEIPDLAKGGLALSGVALAGSRGDAGDVFFPKVVAGVRTFARSDFLVYSATAFNASADADVMRIAVSQGSTVLYRSAWEPLGSRVAERRPDGVRLSGRLGLSAVPPGTYVLRVEVRDAKSTRAASQTAEFAVAQ